ncbi:MAG: glycosyltransferase family 2 protein [Lachnospiraceae bacterium]|nr:glycosyltransferase family 2 protein [Lachnospiraceae bacterium]
MSQEMVYAPVAISACYRDEHLNRCIQSLKKNTYADKTELYISVDYPPSESRTEGWEKVCRMLKNPIEGFDKVHVYFQKHNLGLSGNYQFLEKTVFAKYDRLIHTEDDNEFSVNFLTYMNKGLALYKDHPTVYGIVGYAHDYQFNCGENNVVALTDFSAWGMGIWREKEKIIHEQLTMENWLRAAQNYRLMWKLYSRRKKLFSRMLGTILSTSDADVIPNVDVNRGIFLALNGFCTINPIKSKVRNWGWDGSGLHTKGSAEENILQTNLELDEDEDFEFRLKGGVQTSKFNDRLLDDNNRWGRERVKWYNDPMLYLLYRLLGKDRFLRFTHRR